MNTDYYPVWWFDYFEKLRIYEMKQIVPFLEKGQTVLEIGAGAGWQSRFMAKEGLKVVSIDVEQSNYQMVREWPVLLYDGTNIPLANHSVDVIYSSSVLEHIPHIEAFQNEMKRILKPNGYAIHVMPNATWRFWTSLTLYPASCRRLCRKFQRRRIHSQFPAFSGESTKAVESIAPPKIRKFQLISELLWPQRHGEIGNAFTELYYFSRRRWVKLFQRHGWEIQTVLPNQLFYTGDFILSPYLGLKGRAFLSRILGSVCFIYVMRTPRP